MNKVDLTSLIQVPHSSNVSNAAHWSVWWAWLTSSLFACWLPLPVRLLHKRSWMGFHNYEVGECQNCHWIAESYSSHCSSDWCTSLQPGVWQFCKVLFLFCIHWVLPTALCLFCIIAQVACFNYELICFPRNVLLVITLFSSNP